MYVRGRWFPLRYPNPSHATYIFNHFLILIYISFNPTCIISYIIYFYFITHSVLTHHGMFFPPSMVTPSWAWHPVIKSFHVITPLSPYLPSHYNHVSYSTMLYLTMPNTPRYYCSSSPPWLPLWPLLSARFKIYKYLCIYTLHPTMWSLHDMHSPSLFNLKPSPRMDLHTFSFP